MRPDEHKRKKNEQYKKKHGIKSAKQKNVSEEQHAHKAKLQTAENQKVFHTHVQRKELPSDDDEGTTVTHRKFSRRKVESNWHRYELEKEAVGGDYQSQHGADFQQLLSQTASSLSQFRFKDEEIWENEETSSEEISALSINCDDILSAAICVPLHNRLNIGTEHFEENHIDLITDCAEQNRRKQVITTSVCSNIEDHTEKMIKGEENEHLLLKLEQGGEQSSIVELELEDELSEILNNSKEETMTMEDEEGSTLNKVELTSTSPMNEKTEDDVLDELLGFSSSSPDKPKAQSSVQSSQPNNKDNEIRNVNDSHKQNKVDSRINTTEPEKNLSGAATASRVVNTVSLEDQLDELLGLDSDSVNAKPSVDKKDTITKTSSHEKKPTEPSLEDWLDSVLED